ncbi:MAG: Ig-like domain-containing protein [Bacteroidales bacterium]|nr:Ig-like domain-containing protein [Bacteroidales bacterium]
MKKVLTLLAIFAMVGLVSCKKEPAQATITASDVTVEEGSTVKINASTNSSATITYASDNTAIATVAADGTVTGVKAGSANISIKVAAVKDAFTAAEKSIKVTVTAKADPTPGPSGAAIVIDGDFADWAALPSNSYTKTYGDEEATHPALTHCKVYADPNYIYVYFEWDTDAIEAVPGVEHVPFHCYINTDGDATTGGYGDEFAEACSDILLEGHIYGGGEEGGELGSYDPGAYNWIGEPGANGWGWCGEPGLISAGSGLGEGAGVEGKYEFKLDRSMLQDVGYPVADVFGIGFDIQQNWESVGILPSTAPDEGNSTGYLPLLVVTTQK